MKTSTVNISFNSDLLEEIDRVAGHESRARSELIREAARMYISRKKQWKKIFSFGTRQAKTSGLKESDVGGAIRQFRHSKGRQG
ncbi:MAG: ribbon-helix-helix protein, CopG family [Candidatus Omnitrophica bacterium]|nr:ribbon-helix-helix protein, CopG family [Candidatus Omnitrophota bacterium]